MAIVTDDIGISESCILQSTTIQLPNTAGVVEDFCKRSLDNFVCEILGISGAALTYALTPSILRHSLGDTVLHENMNTIQGLFVEFILTLVLTLTVYASRDTGRKCEGYHSSLAYGFATVSCYLVGVSVY